MLRSDIWAAAFVRRHNDLGRLCVVTRRGDPIAGQIFIEVDHLDGRVSLYAPAPVSLEAEAAPDRLFQRRFDHAEPQKVRDRLTQEQRFDPDYWVLTLELRDGDLGLLVVQ